MQKPLKGKNSPRSKPVIQYSKNNIYIKEWNSIHEATRELCFKDISNIVACCKGRRKSAYGFIWRYAIY
jgi:hypothetical protein